VRAPPDGHTLLAVATPSAINATLYDKLNFNFMRDIAPVAAISREANVILVNPSVPAKTVPEFIAYAKANAGKINYASPGNGTAGHVSGELFKMMAGVNMVHVPYRGGAPEAMRLFGENPDAARGFFDALKKGDFSEARTSLNASLDRRREEDRAIADRNRIPSDTGKR
jgi:tripartite-type tricarboxylate transporter receptor subunit TctC